MANPFLMDDDFSVENVNDAASNPFLIQSDGQNDTENPFAAQANNPFAGFGDEDLGSAQVTSDAPPTTVADIFMVSTGAAEGNSLHTVDPAMSFFGTTINEDDPPQVSEVKHPQLAQFDDGKDAYSSEEELGKKKLPPGRPVPPSQTTQDLIFAVADQLDQASSQMLGRLPATRTPSPVSMRDLHSPSPIPDAAMADLLDVSDDSQPPTSQSGAFDVDLMGGANDNPFAPTSTPNLHGVAPAPPAAKPQPTRPPPPRPVPPRPTPPAVTNIQQQPVQPTPPQTAPQSQEPDLFDMFGDSTPKPVKPPPPKTKEDILSLFSAPKTQPQPQQIQPDLLSGDILLDNIASTEVTLPPPLTEVLSQPIVPPAVAPAVTQPFSMTQSVTVSITEPSSLPETEPEISAKQETLLETEIKSENEKLEEVEPIAEAVESKVEEEHPVMDSITPETQIKRAPTPDIEITTVEDLPRSDDEEELPPPQPKEIEATEGEKLDSDQSETTTINQAPSSPMDTSIQDHTSEPEQMDTGLDFAPSIPSGQASANPFASPESEDAYPPVSVAVTNIFATDEVLTTTPAANIFAAEEPPTATSVTNIFAVEPSIVTNIFEMDTSNAAPVTTTTSNAFSLDPLGDDEFDAFSAKFESVKKEDNLLDGFGGVTPTTADAWGSSDAFGTTDNSTDGFGNEEGFDSFLAMQAPQEPDSPEDKEFSVVIRPKEGTTAQSIAPILAPPPPPPRGSQNNSIYSGDSSPRINPFDKSDEVASAEGIPAIPEPASMQRTDSQETPPTPLFDEDVSQPLEDFPRLNYTGTGWEMQLRQPNKKKITGQRFWKKVFIRLVYQGDNPVLQLFNQQGDKEPFQELPLQPSYSVSDIGAQQYDQFGKIFTVKLQYIFYKERPGVRPGQVTKAERITNKLSQFAAYAIQGDYQGVKEFGSDLKKLGLPVEHAPQVSQLFKIGSMSYEDLKQFSICVEEALFKLPAHRDRALNYKFEEVQVTAVDEIYVEQDAEGHVNKQIARVRLFFLGFLSGMPTIELGLNDLVRQGKEVVGRHDIIPVVTEEWIRLEGVEFHTSVQQDEYERTRTIKFQPPDACYIELMRFRVRPPKNRELPLQLKATWCVTGNRVELRADVLVPGFASRKLGQIPCEDVAIRFPIPECWIYLFRVEKHFRYGSVKSAHRRTGKIKGIERILGTVDTLQESLIEVTSGQAKYEHPHRALVWRCPRLPKEGQGAYTTHQLVCRMALTSYDQIPEQLAPYCYVEFTMPATQVSHTTVRSVSVQDSDSDEPPEKYVRYLARHEYRVGIEHTTGESPNAYLAATRIKEERTTATTQPQPVASPMAPSDSDSDSN